MLIVGLVEADAEGTVGLVESVEHPSVHLLPKRTHLGIPLLPLHQHLMHIVDHLGMLLLHLRVGHVAIAHQMISLDAGALRGSPVEELLPRVHALADVHAAVIHQRRFDHLVAASREQPADGIPEQIVADVAEVKGLVGIGR